MTRPGQEFAKSYASSGGHAFVAMVQSANLRDFHDPTHRRRLNLSIVAVAFFIRHFLNAPDMLLALTILQLILGLLWWGWTEIRLFFREAIHKMLQRRRDGKN
jgi:hypothetical protein